MQWQQNNFIFCKTVGTDTLPKALNHAYEKEPTTLPKLHSYSLFL